MPRYTLDTDTCSYIMKRSNSGVLNRLSSLPVGDVCISVITKSELLFGVEVSPRRQQDEAALEAFLNYIEVLDFPDPASPHYARIRTDLRRQGSMIGANDLFIAAHVGIPVKVNAESSGKPNGVPVKANNRRSEATLAG
jgi:tRNA(fMet)-specific endonuclease VapC